MQDLRTLATALACTLAGAVALAENQATISSSEIEDHVGYLASDELEGRGTATPGERKAGAYLAKEFASYGLRPGAADGTFYQGFHVAGKTTLGTTALQVKVGSFYRDLDLREDFNPFGFSSSFKGKVPVVFAGYGVTNEETGYDDYAGLDVKGKAVLVLRYEPNQGTGRMSRHATFARKAENAKAHGAVALLVVTDPLHHDGDETVLPFRSGADAGIFAAHVRQSVGVKLFELAGKDLLETQKTIDANRKPSSFTLDASIDVNVSIKREDELARNVVAVLPGTDPKLKDEVLVIGAHYDHLGRGGHGGSLAPGSRGEIHNGADDNASGTAAILELAEAFAAQPPRRTIYFVGFSGEERGLLGSQHFVANPPIPVETIAAMINLDMIGRLRNETVEVGGAGTAPNFADMIKRATAAEGLKVTLNQSGFGPSDHASFYRAKIPVMFFFTGLHGEYHRPTDDVHLLNADGAMKVTRAAYSCAREIADADARPSYVNVPRQPRFSARNRGPRVGVMIDSAHQGAGIKIADAPAGGGAAKAGLKGGDVLLTFDGKTLNTIQDLRAVLGKKKSGDTVKATIKRGASELTVEIQLQ